MSTVDVATHAEQWARWHMTLARRALLTGESTASQVVERLVDLLHRAVGVPR